MKKEMLINVLQPEECRIAILEDGILEELYVERTSHESYVGNIYKGRIVNIEPSIQAAFVDFGVGRNGFLHVSDVEPAYYRHLEQHGDDRRPGGRDRDRDRGPRRSGGGGGGGGRGGRGPSRREREPRPHFEDNFESFTPEEMVEPLELTPIDAPLPHEMNLVEPLEMERLDDIYDAPPPAETALAAPPLEPDSMPAPMLPEPVHLDESADEAPGDAPAAPETPAEPEAERARPRRRARGGRSRRPKADESTAAPPEAAAEAPEPPPDKPRPMESAERRTSPHDDEIEPLEPAPLPLSGQDFSDDDLSFSARPPAASSVPVRETPPRVRETPPPVQPRVRETPPPVQPREPAGTAPMRHEAEPLFTDADPLHDAGDLIAEREEREERAEHEEHADRDLDEQGMFEEPLPEYFDDEEPTPQPRPGGRRDDRRDDRRGRRPGSGGRRMGGGGGRPGMGRPKPLIQDIFKRGQEVLVQVIKEGIGTKGPTLSTYISIAGRYLVLMPGLNRIGVSRKIADEEQRRRLRDILNDLKPPKGLGFIIRTAGLDRTKKELQGDLAYLSRLWQVMVRRIRKIKSPAEIYQESDMIIRTLRDTFTNEIDTIYVDEPTAFEHAQEFLTIVMPRYANRLKLYQEREPLFHKRGIEDEIARIQLRHVPLPNGGSIVIDQTEALVAIDVNSGNFRADNNAEETAYQMNILAAREIARQLRLRDLGGVIVNDFIDMRDEKHRRGVEKALRDAMRRDRARTKILKISQFGIIEMTRQRIRPSLKRSIFQDCPHCHSTGQVKTCESVSIDVMRLLQLGTHREQICRIEVRVHDEVAQYLQNRKRKEISQLEELTTTQIVIHGRHAVSPELMELQCYDTNNNEVKLLSYDAPAARPRRR